MLKKEFKIIKEESTPSFTYKSQKEGKYRV